ncbi:hypothetical protein BU16DRAFT_580477 [Lophium mytilinum]|uniref:Uncharacterized protein n=1 Tax=Lophium mytilinum TaxID=390894 RepID=A0A6A6R3D1_9PEZI|nr:hypothetical protein BU16DRAFT_580477 [Lophium mytilinum]
MLQVGLSKESRGSYGGVRSGAVGDGCGGGGGGGGQHRWISNIAGRGAVMTRVCWPRCGTKKVLGGPQDDGEMVIGLDGEVLWGHHGIVLIVDGAMGKFRVQIEYTFIIVLTAFQSVERFEV